VRLDRRVRIQLALFAVITLAAGAVLVFRYINAPALFFGAGHYTVAVELRQAGGLYPKANVTYRGTEVGEVKGVRLTKTGVAAVLSLRSDVAIPSDLRAEVHSQTAIGEQYVELLPRSGGAAPLKDGDVIAAADTEVPPAIDSLLDSTNRGLAAIPEDNLKTAIDESYTAIGGLGPELSRLVKGSTQVAVDADRNLDSLITVIDQSAPILDSQADSAAAIQAWASHLATVTDQLRAHDASVAGVLQNGGSAADEGRRLFERLKPTLPLLLANLVSVGEVAVTYQPAIEQLLVLLPQSVALMQGTEMANLHTKQDYKGLFLDFQLNLNLPPVCTTGFLPPQQWRAPSAVDYPDRPAGDLYCRTPQDAPFGVRGAKNYPCQTVPGKRAPTVKMCESNEQYVPLNDGDNWKGDPNATLSGQAIPQPPPGLPPGVPAAPQGPAPPAQAAPPITAAEYDPATGSYFGPDGRLYSQSDLSQAAPGGKTWQSMLIPPGN
jgi:phospholipid/cholesterol/gamma-HCH transport system substrate-binding protein